MQRREKMEGVDQFQALLRTKFCSRLQPLPVDRRNLEQRDVVEDFVVARLQRLAFQFVGAVKAFGDADFA